jgi:hypothetical protein
MGTGAYTDPKIRAYKTAGNYSSTGQYRFVKLSANNIVTTCDTKGETAVGVLKTATSSGKVAEVFMAPGGALVRCGETIARNEQLTTSAAGNAVNPDSSGQEILAVALEAGDSGDIIAVNLNVAGETFAAEA